MTRDSKCTRLTVNVQLRRPGTNIAEIYKTRDQICELNYRRTKCEIGIKVGDQKYNFVLLLLLLFDVEMWCNHGAKKQSKCERGY